MPIDRLFLVIDRTLTMQQPKNALDFIRQRCPTDLQTTLLDAVAIATMTGDDTALRQIADTENLFRRYFALNVLEFVAAERGERKRLIVSIRKQPAVIIQVSRVAIIWSYLPKEAEEQIGSLVDYVQSQNVNDEYAGGWVKLNGEWLGVPVDLFGGPEMKTSRQVAKGLGFSQDDLNAHLEMYPETA